MNEKLRVAVVGYGRIGKFHAQHVRELAETEANCELVAIVDPNPDRAKHMDSVSVFPDSDTLIASQVANAAIICSATHTHQPVAEKLVAAGFRVLMEKPMTDCLESDRTFTAQLNAQSPHAVMLAFQRRYDPALQYARSLLQQRRVGDPFKIISILEDSGPPPEGYASPGLLLDMSVHNIDEIIWLIGATPTAIASVGARVHNHKISSVVEDFDDATIHLKFDHDLVGRIDVSRLHVPGYHVETIVYCEHGIIRVGAYQSDPLDVAVETLGRGEVLERRDFRCRDYRETFPDTPIPEFIPRFGAAYKAELADFVEKCHSGQPFAVDQNDGLRAGEIAAAGNLAVSSGGFQSIDLS